MTDLPIPSPKRRAAVLVAADELSDEQIAAAVGITRRTLTAWKRRPDFAALVGDHTGKLQAGMLRLAIAKKRVRLGHLDDLHARYLRLIAARGAEMAAEVPGGETGLLVRQTKVIGTGRTALTVTEYVADVPVTREIRALEEQAARELGQWVERTELGGTVAAVRLVGVDPADV